MLSVLAHPEFDIAEAAIEAIAQLPAEQARLYFDVIITALPSAIRQLLKLEFRTISHKNPLWRFWNS